MDESRIVDKGLLDELKRRYPDLFQSYPVIPRPLRDVAHDATQGPRHVRQSSGRAFNPKRRRKRR